MSRVTRQGLASSRDRPQGLLSSRRRVADVAGGSTTTGPHKNPPSRPASRIAESPRSLQKPRNGELLCRSPATRGCQVARGSHRQGVNSPDSSTQLQWGICSQNMSNQKPIYCIAIWLMFYCGLSHRLPTVPPIHHWNKAKASTVSLSVEDARLHTRLFS